ncbi:PTS sugar transporter subunit IIA [Oceanobacillus polygoni]|uniref:PTS system glucose-specific IIA component n=1 Tax=Oceanobacillus polygoni TaxID=1235259 RepID=A0A9X0YP47_9BACI|nr:PTS glucose transporter subunit IIA [Oceanobacillus polygoni]MBP2076143.1 PTS system glucose-specific IIA component [Oceanobacillus polygoni]
MFKKLFKQKKEENIVAPLNGKIVPIEEVPDPVFNQKMMGEGIAIVPEEGMVYSPVNGKIVQLAETKHAIGIVTDGGVEILIHIGLETVGLKGEGFASKVNVGEEVSAGQLLMEVDLEYIGEHASDTITPIVITNSAEGNKTYRFTSEKIAKAKETVIITAEDK